MVLFHLNLYVFCGKLAIEALIQEDSFYKNEVADYQIVEFIPSKTAVGLEAFKQAE